MSLLDSYEAVRFQPSIGPCINLPEGTATENGSLNGGWSLALQPAHNDDGSSSGYDMRFVSSFYGDLYGAGATFPKEKRVFIKNNLVCTIIFFYCCWFKAKHGMETSLPPKLI